ncbi:hypothetical protein FOA52_002920 [Chlamydomonas sp. UWO 241]|nr:hypothetical protein FOA52_002920 [Chlamydomonas sp. UWO 241]
MAPLACPVGSTLRPSCVTLGWRAPLGHLRPACARQSLAAPCSTSAAWEAPRRCKPNSASCTPAAAASVAAPAPSSSSQPQPQPLPRFDAPDRHGVRDATGRLLLKNLSLAEMEAWCVSVGERPSRAPQLFEWMYGRRGEIVRSLGDAIKKGPGDEAAFGTAFLAKVDSSASISGGLSLQAVHTALDGTTKLVFALNPDESGRLSGSVETVLIPMTNASGVIARYTACVSSQVGCAMNCQFCHTGRMGLLANLSTAQIVEQILEARRWLVSSCPPELQMPIANVVFMGMGEPFHNYDVVLAAVDVMAEPMGLKLSRNKIVVSTVGLVPQMRAFLDAGKAKLALSLHATTDEVRDWIVPVNRRYPLADLVALLEEYFPTASARGDRFIVIEYVMLAGVNDGAADAERLAQLLENVYCMINLIVYNPHDGTPFQRSSDADIAAFRRTLAAAGKVCTVRASKGDDTMAACGQLGDASAAARPGPRLDPPERLAGVVGRRASGGGGVGSAVFASAAPAASAAVAGGSESGGCCSQS